MVPRNIVVSQDGKIAGEILDWEMAGYYPDFYEFYRYLNEFKEHDASPSTFIDTWLDVFWTLLVVEVEPIEDYIFDEYRAS